MTEARWNGDMAHQMQKEFSAQIAFYDRILKNLRSELPPNIAD